MDISTKPDIVTTDEIIFKNIVPIDRATVEPRERTTIDISDK